MASRRNALLILFPALLLPTAIFLHSRFSVFGVFRSHFRSAPSFAADNELLMLDSLKQCEDLELVGGIKSGGWEKKVLVEDDGGWMRSASSAVIVGIDPEGNGGRKQGWVVIAGFLGEGVGVIKLDL